MGVKMMKNRAGNGVGKMSRAVLGWDEGNCKGQWQNGGDGKLSCRDG